MRVTKVTVREGITYNNPYTTFSNFRHDVEISADFDRFDDDEEIEKLRRDAREHLLEMQQTALREARKEVHGDKHAKGCTGEHDPRHGDCVVVEEHTALEIQPEAVDDLPF